MAELAEVEEKLSKSMSLVQPNEIQELNRELANVANGNTVPPRGSDLDAGAARYADCAHADEFAVAAAGSRLTLSYALPPTPLPMPGCRP